MHDPLNDYMTSILRICTFSPYSISSSMQFWPISNSENGPKGPIRSDLKPRDHEQFNWHFWSIFTVRNGPKVLAQNCILEEIECGLKTKIEELKSRDNKFLRSIQWTETASTCICCHVTTSYMNQKSYTVYFHFEVTSMLVTDVGDQMCWLQIWDVGHVVSSHVTNIKKSSPSSNISQ